VVASFIQLLFITCEKETDKPAGDNKVVLTSTIAGNPGYFNVNVTSSITQTGGQTITDHGFCYGTTPNPDINATVKSLGKRTEQGDFSAELTNLEDNKKYFIRSFASFSGGTIYGSQKEITTLKTGKPDVIADSVFAISTNTALFRAKVVSDSGLVVIARGACWNTTGNPTLQNCINFTTDGQGTGSFTTNITGLNASTTYYVRAYATNSEGTTYDDDDVSFTTLVAWSCGATLNITHTAGAIAPVNKTVNYGTVQSSLTGSTKCWITQNLGSDHQATSATDATEASAGWYWQFNRKQGYKHDGTTRTPNTTWITPLSENSDWLPANDPCTLLLGSGWRLPTGTEWETADATGDWDNYNETFASVLKLHAAGYLINSDGSLNNRGSYGYYWSSSQYNSDYGRGLYFSSGYSGVGSNSKAIGFTTRCLSD
jgi:hypothetical protein